MDPRTLSGQAYRPPRCRRRRCLLKDCGQWFQPTHPQCRYCSAACREAARRWRRWHAQQTYRASDHGREHRQQQARRYRRRCQERPSPAAALAAGAGAAAACSRSDGLTCVGKRPANKMPKGPHCPCDRPGCYVLFARNAACPGRHFCCALCRKALRCVLEREARWRQRRRRGLQPAGRRRRARARSP